MTYTLENESDSLRTEGRIVGNGLREARSMTSNAGTSNKAPTAPWPTGFKSPEVRLSVDASRAAASKYAPKKSLLILMLSI